MSATDADYARVDQKVMKQNRESTEECSKYKSQMGRDHVSEGVKRKRKRSDSVL